MNFIIVIFLCFIFNNDVFGKNVRIVGGSDAVINEFPYLVSFRMWASNKHFCAGSIISPTHVLTAAHCLYKIQHLLLVRIIAGANTATQLTGSVYTIREIYLHPFFTGKKSAEEMNYHDITVVKIREYIEYNEFQREIALPTSPNLYLTGTIAGWGLTTYSSESTSEITSLASPLQKAEMTIYTDEQCSSVLPFKIKNEQFCACSSVGTGPCIGDSGGPIVSDGKLIGIISFSIPCGQGIPDMYTNIYSYLDFIFTTMVE